MTVFRIRSDALDWVEAGGEIVALDGRSAVYLSANPTGALLWRRLLSGATRYELVQELTDRFAIDDGHAARDVDAFLGQLDNAGMLAPPT